MPGIVEGKVALVTGAGSGIGRATALEFARQGARVVPADIVSESAEETAQMIRDAGGEASSVYVDVTDEDAVAHAFNEAALAFGGVDVVFSNAGIAPSASIDEMDVATWDRSMAVNARGHFLVVRQAVRQMRRQGLGGAIVLNASKNVCAPALAGSTLRRSATCCPPAPGESRCYRPSSRERVRRRPFRRYAPPSTHGSVAR